ncbi:hypothetical protein BV20DRAFT_1038062 [Pilatotrama ljubarskyi]|nr:hypothetical protein BV20DRAFT_1038062 [Pilatotrama ljubarskyi]
MKRAIALVEYASSDEDNDIHATAKESEVVSQPAPPKRLKKLPSLPAYLAPQVPADNPALHQGRRRTTPHVEGQFAAYCYVPLVVEKQSKLYELLLRILATAKQLVPTLQPIGFSESSEYTAIELHISLTRPTYLRAHQRADFKRAVQQAARSRRKFVITWFPSSFATLSELTNDERTRTFLTLEIGAGHEGFKGLSDDLVPILKSIRQKEFYAEPRFHASIAWALLDGSRMPIAEGQETGPPQDTPDHSEPRLSSMERTAAAPPPSLEASFPTIPCFPPSLVPQLQAEYARELVRPGVGTFETEEVSKWRLQD